MRNLLKVQKKNSFLQGQKCFSPFLAFNKYFSNGKWSIVRHRRVQLTFCTINWFYQNNPYTKFYFYNDRAEKENVFRYLSSSL